VNAKLLEQAKGLPVEERIELVEAIWDTVAEDADAERLGIPESHRRELDRRLADLEANPDDVSPWEEVRARLERL
jgi:putative addiction module component (TIGR02574 family)